MFNAPARTGRLRRWLSAASLSVLVVAMGTAAPAVAQALASAGSSADSTTFNQPGDLLIADQFNNRVIEVNAAHQIVWQFGLGPNDFSARSIIGTNDAQRVGSFTLMAGTGTPPSTVPECPQGCPDNRVILVNRSGQIVWQYGQFGVTGSGPNQLNTPVQSTWLPNTDVLITDQSNERIIEVTQSKEIVWQYGMTGVTGIGFDQLNNPNSAELLANGNILISDENNNRVIEVNRQHDIVWQYPEDPRRELLSGAAFASRLPSGNTLITDSNNNRVIEVTMAGEVVFSYTTDLQKGSNRAPLPTRAVRLATGNTLISDQFNNRVIEVNPAGMIVRQEGLLNVSGYSPSTTTVGLFAPYDAKVVGDYTGLTPPFGFGQ
ncbi:hypothetical protein [Sinomonas sp. ASV322]|uniref:hypothetical protein n=1 Tax=Sinomonas sp. ASV322 TaxID=3041920 RepID=UPI0027DD080E|nr:hypothetical protein [Sinomonas sp. ASV322]MDQ4500848.1 hypothetical protein [Sinomonas sp. ASV322]